MKSLVIAAALFTSGMFSASHSFAATEPDTITNEELQQELDSMKSITLDQDDQKFLNDDQAVKEKIPMDKNAVVWGKPIVPKQKTAQAPKADKPSTTQQ